MGSSSAFKRAYGAWKGKKEDLRSELARGFNLIACNKSVFSYGLKIYSLENNLF